jgi:hypothetical protein
MWRESGTKSLKTYNLVNKPLKGPDLIEFLLNNCRKSRSYNHNEKNKNSDTQTRYASQDIEQQ